MNSVPNPSPHDGNTDFSLRSHQTSPFDSRGEEPLLRPDYSRSIRRPEYIVRLELTVQGPRPWCWQSEPGPASRIGTAALAVGHSSRFACRCATDAR